MLLEIDHGARCDSHVGEVFRVRCADCDQADIEATPAPTAYIPGSNCPHHDGYPMPCDLCWRLHHAAAE